MTPNSEVLAHFPSKLKFLFHPAPYKVLWGGRDGMKSWGMGRALLIMGAENKLRWLCARETQDSIGESVHQLLEEQIIKLGLSNEYRVERNRIVGTRLHTTGMYGQPLADPGYSEFVFAGLKHNVNQIKSFEALDGVWVEEAANVSKHSWEVVLPTIRKEGSEIWVSYNPQLDSDDTHRRWALYPPPGAVVVKTSYLDNRWLSNSSMIKIEHLRATDPIAFRTIYDGETRSALEGSIFENEMRLAENTGRILQVPYDRSRPVDCFWDLGFGDACAVWMVQRFPFEYRLIDYLEARGKMMHWYLTELQARGYLYGDDYLPWDLGMHAKLMGGGKSIEEIMRLSGRKVKISLRLTKTEQIDAARMVFPMCYFDRERCADGLQALKHYRYGETKTEGTMDPRAAIIGAAKGKLTREPLHDWASHGASAFQYFALGAKAPEIKKAEARKRSMVGGGWG